MAYIPQVRTPASYAGEGTYQSRLFPGYKRLPGQVPMYSGPTLAPASEKSDEEKEVEALGYNLFAGAMPGFKGLSFTPGIPEEEPIMEPETMQSQIMPSNVPAGIQGPRGISPGVDRDMYLNYDPNTGFPISPTDAQAARGAGTGTVDASRWASERQAKMPMQVVGGGTGGIVGLAGGPLAPITVPLGMLGGERLATVAMENPVFADLATQIMEAPVIGDALQGIGSFHSGKPKDQQKRDAVRQVMQRAGVIDENYQWKLPDGSTFDMGKDGNARLSNGMRYGEIDEADPRLTSIRSYFEPLSTVLTEADPQLSTDWSNYFTNMAYSNQDKFSGAMQNVFHAYDQFNLMPDQVQAELLRLRNSQKINDTQYRQLWQLVEELKAGGKLRYTDEQLVAPPEEEAPVASAPTSQTGGLVQPKPLGVRSSGGGLIQTKPLMLNPARAALAGRQLADRPRVKIVRGGK